MDPRNWTSLTKSPIELHTLKNPWPQDWHTRQHCVALGLILPLDNKPTLWLEWGEYPRFESQAREQAALCPHAEVSEEYPCTRCVEKYSRIMDQAFDGVHQPCVNLPEPGEILDMVG
jgi:hypothetical protein